MITKNNYFFRFIFIFFTLIIFPFPFSYLPFLGSLENIVTEMFSPIVSWIGSSFFNIPEVASAPTGSGDKIYDYLYLLFVLILSLFGSIVWNIINKKPKDYKFLNYWLLVLLRYYLASTMISYGMVKVIKLQFPDAGFYRLLEPFGDFSPMGLALTFLGYSMGYNLFMGIAEVLGGVLLFHKRTKLLGALILIAVTSNIVAINFFYDVPVKLYSSTLLIMAIIICLPDFKRLLNVILLNKDTLATKVFNPIKSQKLNILKLIIKYSFIIYTLYFNINGGITRYKMKVNSIQKSELYGLYEVDSFIANQDTLLPLLTDTTRLRYIAIENNRYLTVYHMDMSRKTFLTSIDSLKPVVTLTAYRDSSKVYSLNYSLTDTTLELNGVFKNDTISLSSKKIKKEDFNINNRGFNWVNEYPYNR